MRDAIVTFKEEKIIFDNFQLKYLMSSHAAKIARMWTAR